MVGSVVLAVVASVAMGVAGVCQAVAARRRSGPAGLVHPMYVLGIGLDVLGWGLSVLAMQHLPLIAVQTVLAASLAVTVMLSAIFLGVRVTRASWVAILVVCGACGVVLGAAATGPPAAPPSHFGMGMAAAFSSLVVLCAISYRHPTTSGCALLAGLGYSGSAIAARAVHGGSVDSLLGEPLVWLIAGYAIVGVVMFGRALETRHDAVNQASAWLWVTEIVVPSIVGFTLLADRVRPGWAMSVAVAILAAVAATMALSNAAGHRGGPDRA